MKIKPLPSFLKYYRKIPEPVRLQTKKAIQLLEENPSHPSLGHKRMAGYEDIWELRVNINYRITYQKVGDTAILRKIGTHDLLRTPCQGVNRTNFLTKAIYSDIFTA